MRFVLDVSSCAKERRGGIGSYGAALVTALRRVAPEHQFALALRPARWLARARVADLLDGARPRLLLDRAHGLTLGKPVHALHGLGVRLPANAPFPRTVTLHDLNVFEFPELASEHWRQRRQARIRQTVERADLIISYSEQGARALGQHLGLPRERVRVVPLGVDSERFHRPQPAELAAVLDKQRLSDRPYLLMVGEYSTRKNPHGLLAAYAASGLAPHWRLVLGGPRHQNADALRQQARALGLPDDSLALPGWVPDEDLPALLAGAGFYVCSSLHEGFGLPVLEAQAVGCPVVCSNRGALPETLGGLGLLFDPENQDDFAGALASLAGDEPLRHRLAAEGPERVAAGFTWDVVARATLAVYLELAAGG